MLRVRFLCFFMAMLVSVQAFAQQSRTELEKRRQSIMEAIRVTQGQLEATKKDKNASLSQLRALQAKITGRQKLINNINQELSQINNNIKYSAQELQRLRQNLEVQKMRYARSVRYAYKSRSSYDMLAFIFSAEDFNGALRRLKYLKKFRDYRKDQAEQIRVTQAKIENKINILNSEKVQKDELLVTEEQQADVLLSEKKEKDEVVRQLKGREKELMADIAKNRKAAKQLDKAINDLIRREIEIARKKAEEEERKRRLEEERKRREEEQKRAAALAANAPNNNTYGSGNASVKLNTGSDARGNTGSNIKVDNNAPTVAANTRSSSTPAVTPVSTSVSGGTAERPSYKLSLTPEVAALSENFANNRGRLPWPVEKGFVAEPFGRHQHVLAEKVQVENNGVEIQTTPNAGVRAVFDGTVTAVFNVPGMGRSVLVSHGQYFTVYSRLGSVSVQKGQKVSTKEAIGTVGPNDDGAYMMHFELWRVNSNNQPSATNPEEWIAR